VDDARWDTFNRKRDVVSRETKKLKGIWLQVDSLPECDALRLLGKPTEREYSLADLLKRPGLGFDSVAEIARLASLQADVSRAVLRAELGRELADTVIEQVEITTKYAGYVEKQKDEVQRSSRLEGLRLPSDLDYAQVNALSFEVRDKLNRHRPETLGQATRISGVTPAAISLLLIHLKKRGVKAFAANQETLDDAAA
jgi:tRNA uridine 5-carboxymethylaminomethyl modification enzyme